MSTSNMFSQGSYSTQRQADAIMYVAPDRDIVFPQQVTIFTTEAFECIMYMCVAPPMIVGAWSMAVMLW